MEQHYRLATYQDDPVVTIRLSERMLKDLVKRCEENGRDINVEINMRLSRTLERDLDRMAEDAIVEAVVNNRLKDSWK